MSEEREEDGFREPPDAARCARAGETQGIARVFANWSNAGMGCASALPSEALPPRIVF